MQITLPENTTHIVICTSDSRGENNNKQQQRSNHHKSVTLDINPDSGCRSSCHHNRDPNISNESNCSCNNPMPKEDPSSYGNHMQIPPSSTPLSINAGPHSLIPTEVDRSERNIQISNTGNPKYTIDSVNNEEYINDEDGNRKTNYNCSECGKCYSTSSNLARHRQTHR